MKYLINNFITAEKKPHDLAIYKEEAVTDTVTLPSNIGVSEWFNVGFDHKRDGNILTRKRTISNWFVELNEDQLKQLIFEYEHIKLIANRELDIVEIVIEEN